MKKILMTVLLTALFCALVPALSETPSIDWSFRLTPGEVLDALPAPEDYAVGAIVALGRYEQDGDAVNGPEPIEWIVLENDGGQALLMSRYALDNRPYHNRLEVISWVDCHLRAWLNGDFLDKAFAREEQAILEPVIPERFADRVSLLTPEQAVRCSAEDLLCRVTDEGLARGVYVEEKGTCWWWLRADREARDYAPGVSHDGSVHDYSGDLVNSLRAVRPVIRVRCDAR